MAQELGPWLFPEDGLTTCRIRPATIDRQTGLWTFGVWQDLLDVVRRVGHQHERVVRNIKPITIIGINECPREHGHRVQLAALKKSVNEHVLNYVNYNGTHAEVNWNEGDEEVEPAYFVITGFDGGWEGPDEQMATLDLGPVVVIGSNQIVRTVLL